MSEQRAGRPAEDTLEEGFAFMPHALFAGELRRVHVRLAVAADGDDALFREAGEEGVHGLGMPVGFVGKRLINFRGGDRSAVPQHIEDFPFSGEIFGFMRMVSYKRSLVSYKCRN